MTRIIRKTTIPLRMNRCLCILQGSMNLVHQESNGERGKEKKSRDEGRKGGKVNQGMTLTAVSFSGSSLTLCRRSYPPCGAVEMRSILVKLIREAERKR